MTMTSLIILYAGLGLAMTLRAGGRARTHPTPCWLV